MDFATEDLYFRETVAQLKEWGFAVYAPANIFEGTFRYGWVTDGTHILYFEINDFEGLHWSIECVPSRETGSGMCVDVGFSKEGILDALNVSYGAPYPNFESFQRAQKKWYDIVRL